MQTAQSPIDESVQSLSKIELQPSSSKHTASLLINQNSRAIWRYRIVIICLSLMFSLLITLLYTQELTANRDFSFKRTCLLLFAYAWPVIPCLGLLERWTRTKTIGLSFFYTSIASVLIMLNLEEGSSLTEVMIWQYGQLIPPLVIISILTGPNIRALGPYLLMVSFLLISSSLVGYQILEQILEKNDLNSWVISLAELSNAYFVFFLFGIFPWLIVFFPLRYIAKSLANLYQHKFFSEPLYLLSGISIFQLTNESEQSI